MMMVNILVLDSMTNPITMIQGLVWLLPFLYFGYLFEIYNAYALYYIYIQVKFCKFDGSFTLFLFSSLMQPGTWLPCPFSFSCLGLVKMTCSQMCPTVHDQVTHFTNFRQPDHCIHDHPQKAERPHPQSAQVPVYQVNFKIHNILTIMVIFSGPTDWTSTSGHTESAGIQTDRFVASRIVCGNNDVAEEIVIADTVDASHVFSETGGFQCCCCRHCYC